MRSESPGTKLVYTINLQTRGIWVPSVISFDRKHRCQTWELFAYTRRERNARLICTWQSMRSRRSPESRSISDASNIRFLSSLLVLCGERFILHNTREVDANETIHHPTRCAAHVNVVIVPTARICATCTTAIQYPRVGYRQGNRRKWRSAAKVQQASAVGDNDHHDTESTAVPGPSFAFGPCLPPKHLLRGFRCQFQVIGEIVSFCMMNLFMLFGPCGVLVHVSYGFSGFD